MPGLVPGAAWATLDDLEPATNKLHSTVSRVIATANFRHLGNAALAARITKTRAASPGVTCTVNTQYFTFGMNNVVFKITFSDGLIWIARICHSPGRGSDGNTSHRTSMLSEIATLKTLQKQTTIPVPDVYTFETSTSNAFGYPYMLMKCLEGQMLSSTAARHVPVEYHPHVARQLANVMFQLQNVEFNQLGKIWCGENCDKPPQIIPYDDTYTEATLPLTSLEWFYKERQDQNRKALEAHAEDPEWRTACWILKSAIAHIVAEDKLHGPFPLCHFDLHYGNLLFDDAFNLTGVLDWSGAGTAPVERLAVSPEFITFPGMTDEQNQVIIDFRNRVRDDLADLEAKARQADPVLISKTLVSAILGTERADIIHRCTYSFPHRALWDGRLVAELIYKDAVSWEQLVAVYGHSDVY
ncbi:hypothetical protein LLEC1_05571 [Akanthomyces lecanii]|uniref:Aminoglycoside phosphotransferase domain-containing protein n=1 Tax=Cordyceps confragosa TaxID=2714763 RepID=A0A179IA07_CORDF|nr:hypothetical protein LLEC1_05571 [Akanthomyces lecanii]